MASCWISQTVAIFVLLAISKPCIRFQRSLYRFRPKSTHLSSGTLGLPSRGLVQYFPSGARICIAYHILRIMPYFASCCLRIAPWLIVFPLLVFLHWVELGDEYVIEEPVEYVYEDQAFVFQRTLQERRPYLRNHFYVCLLDARSFAMPMLRYLPLAISCHPYCHVNPLTILS